MYGSIFSAIIDLIGKINRSIIRLFVHKRRAVNRKNPKANAAQASEIKFTVKTIADYYYAHRAEFDEPFRVRIHRALSWLRKAKTFTEDPDFMFISLWISFNAAYGREIKWDFYDQPAEAAGDRSGYKAFLSKVCACDEQRRIYDALWVAYSGPVRNILSNHYTFQSYWDFQKGKLSAAEIAERYEQNKSMVTGALATLNTEMALSLLFDRLYVVRNQLVHGGSTYNSRVNREQILCACRILSVLMPIFLQILMENHDKQDWGELVYPFVKD